jgi:TolB-like protein/tetratricopeptide (TPR) repeat protein
MVREARKSPTAFSSPAFIPSIWLRRPGIFRIVVAESSHAVFLSYASQDGEAAQNISTALRASDIEVFFDQSELRGGDVWDQKIRREIQECALFIAVISSNTASRHEGYFRLEWDLADQRSHMIARSRVFIVPVCLDSTTEVAADVPESFRRVQWTRLPGGDTPAAFVERIKHLLSPELSESKAAGSAAVTTIQKPVVAFWRSRMAVVGAIAVVIVALGYLAANRLLPLKTGAEVGAAPAPGARIASAIAFNPPSHSIAVLPFVNMSGDAKQEYFSDGLSEEILSSLTAITGLRVAARTSSFTFKTPGANVADIAHRLNVATVLEGSVRKDGSHIRITAQLINASTGFQMWSQTFDRNLTSILSLQTEIAIAVTETLRATLLADAATTMEIGGTHNPSAFDAYLHGKKLERGNLDKASTVAMIAAFSEAIRIDPGFARAHVGAANAQLIYASDFASAAEIGSLYTQAAKHADTAIALAPELGEAHASMAAVQERWNLDFARAQHEYERALTLSPNDADVLSRAGVFFVIIGKKDLGLVNVRRATVLDNLNPEAYWRLSLANFFAHNYRESIDASERALKLNPDDTLIRNFSGLNHLLLRDFDGAGTYCGTPNRTPIGRACMAIMYDKLHRHPEAEAELATMKAEFGQGAAFQYAEIYAQWGGIPSSLEWLETAYRLPDSAIGSVRVDALLDPLRKDPRFKEIERKLKLPN